MMDKATDPTGPLSTEEINMLRAMLAEYSAGELDDLLTEIPDMSLDALEEDDELS